MDKLLIKERLTLIDSYCNELENIKDLSYEEFANSRNSAAAESYLRRSLEAVFDIGRHILAKTGGVELSAEYKSIARGLGERKVISAFLSETLVAMAGYRNRLVHLYYQIGNEELYDIIQNHISDIREFVRQIYRYVKES